MRLTNRKTPYFDLPHIRACVLSNYLIWILWFLISTAAPIDHLALPFFSFQAKMCSFYRPIFVTKYSFLHVVLCLFVCLYVCLFVGVSLCRCFKNSLFLFFFVLYTISLFHIKSFLKHPFVFDICVRGFFPLIPLNSFSTAKMLDMLRIY